MSETKWTAIPEYPGYAVDLDGNVYSLSSNWRGYGVRKLTTDQNSDGYASVRIIVSGKRIRLAVHRIMAKVFLPPKPSPNHQIRHLDGDRMNPSFGNLTWGTAKENADDREAHGRTVRGENHPNTGGSISAKIDPMRRGGRAHRREAHV